MGSAYPGWSSSDTAKLRVVQLLVKVSVRSPFREDGHEDTARTNGRQPAGPGALQPKCRTGPGADSPGSAQRPNTRRLQRSHRADTAPSVLLDPGAGCRLPARTH